MSMFYTRGKLPENRTARQLRPACLYARLFDNIHGVVVYPYALTVILLLFILGCTTAPSTQISSDINPVATNRSGDLDIKLYREAITELSNHNLEKAKSIFLQIIKNQPELAGPWANLALIYLKEEQYEKADQHIKAALKKNPEMAQALNIAGYISSRKGEINKAIALYEKAIANKADYALAHYNLALLYDVYLQDIPKALQHYQIYLPLIHYEDQNTIDWVEELKLNITE